MKIDITKKTLIGIPRFMIPFGVLVQIKSPRQQISRWEIDFTLIELKSRSPRK